MARVKGMNRHQKAAHKVGEPRVGREQLDELLQLSRSAEVEERLTAAQFLCPCHVRRRVEAAWEALYRLLEDPEPRVRRAAWHTLDDGGRPDDPKLDAVIARALRGDPDEKVRGYARKFAGSRQEGERAAQDLAARPVPRTRGRCDFCGRDNIPIERDLTTMIPSAAAPRPALICERCARAG
jgi:HEAT repeat protein